jgi:hypothetical protein
LALCCCCLFFVLRCCYLLFNFHCSCLLVEVLYFPHPLPCAGCKAWSVRCHLRKIR